VVVSSTADGVVLGHGTVIADLLDRPGDRTGLAIAGHEERILALLSLGRGAWTPPAVLRQFACASRFLERGRTEVAAVALCQAGQPPTRWPTPCARWTASCATAGRP